MSSHLLLIVSPPRPLFCCTEKRDWRRSVHDLHGAGGHQPAGHRGRVQQREEAAHVEGRRVQPLGRQRGQHVPAAQGGFGAARLRLPAAAVPPHAVRRRTPPADQRHARRPLLAARGRLRQRATREPVLLQQQQRVSAQGHLRHRSLHLRSVFFPCLSTGFLLMSLCLYHFMLICSKKVF
jgi:hypothetical protein